MVLTLIIALLIVGFILIGVELFITPGFILGVAGMIFIGMGIYMTFDAYGNIAGLIVLSSVAIVLLLGIIYTFRSGFWKRVAIQDQIISRVNELDQNIKVGEIGQTLGTLRPSGTAMISGQRLEVHTDGEFIENQQEIIISRISGNKIYVKRK